MSSLRFFTILIVGRLPWIIASAALGSTIHMQQYSIAIIISVIAVIGFILGYIYKDKMMDRFSNVKKTKGTSHSAKSKVNLSINKKESLCTKKGE